MAGLKILIKCVVCDAQCCNDPVTYFYNLVFLGLQAIKSVKVENVSELHFMQLTNRFQVAMVHLFSNRPQMTLRCGKNKNVANKPAIRSLMFLPHFGVFFDLLLNRCITT